jgi:hypothetical protein
MMKILSESCLKNLNLAGHYLKNTQNYKEIIQFKN